MRPRIARSKTFASICNRCNGLGGRWLGGAPREYDVVYCPRCGVILRNRGGALGGNIRDFDVTDDAGAALAAAGTPCDWCNGSGVGLEWDEGKRTYRDKPRGCTRCGGTGVAPPRSV